MMGGDQFPPIDPVMLARIMDDPEAAGLPPEQPVEPRGVSEIYAIIACLVIWLATFYAMGVI